MMSQDKPDALQAVLSRKHPPRFLQAIQKAAADLVANSDDTRRPGTLHGHAA